MSVDSRKILLDFSWFCAVLVLPSAVLQMPFPPVAILTAALSPIYGAVHLATKWRVFSDRIMSNMFITVLFLTIGYCAALGEFEALYAAVISLVPLFSHILSGSTFFWSLASACFTCATLFAGKRLTVFFQQAFPNVVPVFGPERHTFLLFKCLGSFFCIVCYITRIITVAVDKLIWHRKQMLASISHEIRTPLHSIRFCATELAQRPEFRGTMEVQRLVQDTSHLLALTRDVLDLMKMETQQGAGAAALQQVTSKQLIESLEASIEDALARDRETGCAKPPKIHLEVQTDLLPPLFMLDRARVTAVALNFLTNALKYAGRGDIYVRVGVRRDPLQDMAVWFGAEQHAAEKYLVISVVDQGQEAVLNPTRLFDPFVAGVKEERLEGSSSLGLGLALCRLSAVSMGGFVGYSWGSPGSSFSLAVPLTAAVVSARSAAESVQGFSPRIRGSAFRVLAVDDERMNLLIVSRMLKGMGLEHDTASNKTAAIEKLKKSKYDLLLLDYQLGHGETGLDVLEDLRQNGIDWPMSKVSILSAHAASSVRDDCLKAGVVHYLTKPFDQNALEEVLYRMAYS